MSYIRTFTSFKLTIMRIIITSLLLAVILLSGCKKDEKSFEDRLVGLWYVILVQYENCDDPDDNGTYNYPSSCNGPMCVTFEYNSDGTMVITSKEDNDTEVSNGTWSGTKDNFTMCNDGDCITGTIDISGSSAEFVYKDEDNCDATFGMTK